MEKEKNYTAMVERYNVEKSDIDKFLKESIVKFIFFDEEYSDISSESGINEIHKFKSRFPGQTYISIPIKVVKDEYDKYASRIEICKLDEVMGFVVVSKHDLRDGFKEMKNAKKEEKIAFGRELCKEYLDKFNYMLCNKYLSLTIKDEEGNVLLSDNIGGTLEDINKQVENKIKELENQNNKHIYQLI